ncbi:MAG: hypothetical protein HQL79_07460 [Magnetococcales bacterium]|nr:hypothetical protein [Magnetococcales bacterium]
MIADCLDILVRYHPKVAPWVQSFGHWRNQPAKEVMSRLTCVLAVIDYCQAELRNNDVVLWLDLNDRLHVSVYREFMFHIIDRNGTERKIPLTAGSRGLRLRPIHIIRETQP